MVGRLAERAGLPMPKVYLDPQRAAERLRHRAQPGERGGGGDHRHPADPRPRRAGGGDRARAGAREEPRHPDDDGGRHGGRRHLDAGAVRVPLRRRARPGQRDGADRGAAGGDLRADGGDADPDDDQPDAGVFRRPAGGGDQRRPAGAGAGAAQDLGLCRADPDAERRAQPDLGAALHRQSAERAADGQPLLHPPERGEPHPRAGGDGRRMAASPRRRRSGSRPGRARFPPSGAGERARPRGAAGGRGAGCGRAGARAEPRRADRGGGRAAGGAGAGRAGAGAGAGGGDAQASRADRRRARAGSCRSRRRRRR